MLSVVKAVAGPAAFAVAALPGGGVAAPAAAGAALGRAYEKHPGRLRASAQGPVDHEQLVVGHPIRRRVAAGHQHQLSVLDDFARGVGCAENESAGTAHNCG